jgi:hypothetical protein
VAARYGAIPDPPPTLGPREQRVVAELEAMHPTIAHDPSLDLLALDMLDDVGPRMRARAPRRGVLDRASILRRARGRAITARMLLPDPPRHVLEPSTFRYGLATRERDGMIDAALVVAEHLVEIEPFARHVVQDEGVVIAGRLRDGWRSPTLQVVQPDGVHTRFTSEGDAFRWVIPTPRSGTVQVELLAQNARGPQILFVVPIYVETEEPPFDVAFEGMASNTAPTSAGEVEAAVIALLQAERARAGLPPFVVDATLTQVARAHAEDMRDHGFVGHVSPTTGDHGDRQPRRERGGRAHEPHAEPGASAPHPVAVPAARRRRRRAADGGLCARAPRRALRTLRSGW